TESSAEAVERHYEQGPVAVDLAVRPAHPRIGDVVELRLEARAEPGVELLMPEFGEALGRFEIVDFAPSESQEPDGSSRARQVYRLQPNRSGRQSIPALRVEFVDRRPGQKPAPDGEDAYELLTERVALDVATILAADAPLELRPAIGDLGRRRFPGVPGWAWLVGGLVAIAAVGPLLWRAWLAYQARQRQQSAYEIARGELDSLLAKGRPAAETLDAFYVELSLIVRRYLENRFALRSPELTTEEFLGEMGRSPDLARSHQQLLRDFLVQADLVKFAGYRPEAAIVGQSIAAAERFLEDTRDLVRIGGES
ncbi:BatD family protein, partial [Myxococcota bacterium]|nr:BatD family protein [Myxococcota bacterium]